MKILKTDNTLFRARVAIKTDEMRDCMRYLKNNTNAPEGWYNSKNDLILMNWIFKAIEKHPSKEEIVPDVHYIQGPMYNARGTVSSSRISLVDTEPARSGSITPILNIFRRILNPENKDSFNKLVGEEYSADYSEWWNKNIAPIWKNINKSFREKTFFKGNYDKEFNKDFNEQTGNFWIKLWRQTIQT